MSDNRFHDPSSKDRPVPLEFDDIVFGLQRFGGISQYWRELTSRIAAMPCFEVHRRPGTWAGRMQAQRSRCRVFHSSYYRHAKGRWVKTVTTVHDLAYELGFVGSGFRSAMHKLEHRRAFFASDALICVSERTRADLLDVYPALAQRCRIDVAHHGVWMPTPAPIPATPGRDKWSAPYVLFVGGRGAYKNFAAAMKAFAVGGFAREGWYLVCTGAPLNDTERRQASKFGIADSVRGVGPIDRGRLSSLYAGAHALLYPSLFEGFGMPLLEAMSLGCPVVASNTSVMPEIAGDAALLVDGGDPHKLAAALQSLSNVQERAALTMRGRSRASTFTWDRSASRHAAVYLSLGGIDVAQNAS